MSYHFYDPLKEYINVFQDRFKNIAESTFAELVKESLIDIEANRETCRQLYKTEEDFYKIESKISCWRILCIILWFIIAGGIIFSFLGHEELALTPIYYVISIPLELLIIAFLLAKVHPYLKELRINRSNLTTMIKKLKKDAWEQMSSLNSLYDWDILTRMMSKTIPGLVFDPYFTTQRLADLKNTYGWDESFNKERSVIYSHSGLINGNPFVICRTRKMNMGSKTYYGSKTIHWTTIERDSDGKYRTVRHSEILTASVSAPYPEYYEKTRIIYGNTAAPDLIFYRKQCGSANKNGSFSFWRKKRALRKRARNLSNADFAMMTNEEFEVAFETSNRNNNQQYALLFTPIAQECMLDLLRDREVGFGDDFDFSKRKMINTIIPNHMQELDLSMNPSHYKHFDYDKALKTFLEINSRYFRAIYFSLAPLLCVPLYQQMRPLHDIYGNNMKKQSAFWEHEALANFWGQKHFKHPNCVTDCILKTEQIRERDNNLIVTVYAHGYQKFERLVYIDRYGGDGRWHKVPVYWDEYLPVTGFGHIQLREDNNFNDDTISHKQRLDHINGILNESNSSVYRRHIASKL